MTDFHHRLEQEIPRLRRYARALTRNAVRADDLVQETLVRALRKEHLWQAGTNLRAWLFTIMHNQNVNDVRRAVRDDTVDLENCSERLTATTDPTASRQLRELDHALARLPEEHRQVILLIGLEGMSYEDAAAILDVPIGTIRSRLSRGRESLRKLMDMEAKSATGADVRNFTHDSRDYKQSNRREPIRSAIEASSEREQRARRQDRPLAGRPHADDGVGHCQ